jgi:hypothetical protein
MTPESQRIAIAEVCGWTKIMFVKETGKLVGTNPKGNSFRLRVPDYLSDLNAMHEAEKVQEAKDFTFAKQYWRTLCLVTGCHHGSEWEAAFATAAQRAEAFLRTLNLWKDDE